MFARQSSILPMSIPFAVIIPAAGVGARSGRRIPKQYVELLGLPVLRHTLDAFAAIEGCAALLVPVDDLWREHAGRAAAGLDVRLVAGGAERQSSIANGLRHLPSGIDIVLVHDAARPCASGALIRRVVQAAHEHGAAVPVLPVNETVKRVERSGEILETIPRETLRLAQTPQGFRRELLLRAYAAAEEGGWIGTDDSSLVEAAGHRVMTVDGEWENLKITLPEDFERAERTLRRWRG
jgi:2-C-methyl-D-erythritol 4-phosphate cytidylyltransferase